MKKKPPSFGPWTRPVLLFMLAALALNLSCHRKPKWNVLLLTLDTTRADRLRCYGYQKIETPALNRLAREGVLFENAYSPVPLTLPAHATIMSGTVPIYHGVIDNGSYEVPQELTTLAEVLRDRGYQTSAFISATVLIKEFHLDQGFDHWDEEDLVEQATMGPLASERRADTVTDAVLRWLEGKARTPFFMWVHYYDPHQLYNPPKEFAALYPDDYDGEIAFMDSQIKRLLSALEERGLYENTLIIAAGDHGEGLFDHGEPSHAILIYNTTQHVPLIVRIPGFGEPGKRIKTVASLDDIMPTILEYLGIPLPGRISGASLKSIIELPAGEPPERFAFAHNEYALLHYSWSPLSAVIGPRYKFIRAPKPELYDLVADPGELHNIYADNEKLANQYRRKIEDYEKQWADGLQAKTADLDLRRRNQIEDLGYVGQAFKGDPDKARTKDPKDFTSIYLTINDLHKAQKQGLAAETLELAAVILEADPENPMVLHAKGDALASLGRCDEAIAVYRFFQDQQADVAATRLKIAQCLIQQGGAAMMAGDQDRGLAFHREARLELEAARSLDGDDPQIHYFLGRLALFFGEYEQAQKIFQAPGMADKEYGHLGMAVLYSMRDRPDLAESEFEKAGRMSEGDKRLYWQEYANFLVRQGRFGEARDLIAKAAEEDPRMAEHPALRALRYATEQGLAGAGTAVPVPAPAPVPAPGGTVP